MFCVCVAQPHTLSYCITSGHCCIVASVGRVAASAEREKLNLFLVMFDSNPTRSARVRVARLARHLRCVKSISYTVSDFHNFR